MSKIINVLRTEPALILALAQALLSLLTGAGLHLSAGVTGGILAVVSTASGVIVAVYVRDVSAAVITGFVSAAGTLALALGVHHISPGLVSAVNAVVVAAFALAFRAGATPKIRALAQ